MHFGIQERSCIPVSLGMNGNKFFGTVQLALNSAQFTAVPKHDS